MSEKSWECSLLACGALIDACDQIMKGEATNAFCAVRPPGHHAGVFGKTKYSLFFINDLFLLVISNMRSYQTLSISLMASALSTMLLSLQATSKMSTIHKSSKL